MRWKTAFQVAATYVGAVMGAGFASGQEIQQFFANFGYWGMIGIILSASLFAGLGYIMIDLQERWRVQTYTQFFERLLGPKWGPKIDILVSILLLIGMIAMMSGAGALFKQYFGLSTWLGILLTAVVIGLALWFKGEGVLWINSVLIPLKFIFCLGIGLLAILWGTQGDGEGVTQSMNPLIQNWVVSAILYVSLNITLAMVVFASLGAEVQRKGAKQGALLGGIALGVFAAVIGGALIRFPEAGGLEIPMVAIAGKLGNWPAFFYVVVLWLAMITAAIGNAFSLVTKIVGTGKVNYRLVALGLLLLTIPLAGIKFSLIVKLVYPVFGYLGLMFLPLLYMRWRKS